MIFRNGLLLGLLVGLAACTGDTPDTGADSAAPNASVADAAPAAETEERITPTPLTVMAIDDIEVKDHDLDATLLHVSMDDWAIWSEGATEVEQPVSEGAAFLVHELPDGGVLLQSYWFMNGQPTPAVFEVHRMTDALGAAYIRMCARGIWVDPSLDDPGCRIVLHGNQPPLRCRQSDQCATRCRVATTHVRNWGDFYFCSCDVSA